MDYPKFIVSNQKEESIRIQRVNRISQIFIEIIRAANTDSNESSDFFLNPFLYSKTCLKRPLKNRQKKVLTTNGSLMKVESIAEC